ncbi:type II toxin-antitoxin system PemK/MazF family toxin [Sphingobacterium sp. CZ-2]|uniref:type II toxin-antitoxin system PemK/MazF family toxin n=1 Tax=Sphingobacterium sp. CZ-2 TaxID=2557994 RepID=UPI00106F29D5|nr:type II toxin-antitoxin system PemK/MazF family toxin [Sphingobacterium sp. CZ-2]QBR12757.1 type II toxin-antitoxin system PemK/MazF family toxin [Sphingobacterium sp. CZ-2]
MVKRFEIYFVDLNPTIGSEINKIRPAVIVSPNEMNNALNTVIIAPLTSTLKPYPMRVNCIVDGKKGQIALDHLRSIDKTRLISKMGIIEFTTQKELISTLIEMFS